MRRIISISLVLVVGVFLVSHFEGRDKTGLDTDETIDVQPLLTPSSRTITKSPAELSPEGGRLVGNDLAPARALVNTFHGNMRVLERQLEKYYVESETDNEWSPMVTTNVLEWFDGAENEDEIIADCVADMCVVDIYVSYEDFLRSYSGRARLWGASEGNGFLPESFFFPGPNGSIRLYVFRDTFDPDSL